MRPADQARRESKSGICDRGATQPTGCSGGRMPKCFWITALDAKPRRLERGGHLVQELDGRVREGTGIGTKLAAEPEQPKSDGLNVGGLDGCDDLLGLLDKA